MSILDDIRRADLAKRQALAALHAELGYDSPQALAAAILEAAEGLPARASSPRAAVQSASKAKPQSKGAGKGRKLPAEKRQAIIDALKAGVNGTEVTRRFSVSYPTVHSIKQQLGMVQARPGTGPNKGKHKKSTKKA